MNNGVSENEVALHSTYNNLYCQFNKKQDVGSKFMAYSTYISMVCFHLNKNRYINNIYLFPTSWSMTLSW